MNRVAAQPVNKTYVSEHKAGRSLTVKFGAPVAVAVSEPGEKRWGFIQFPSLSRLPDGGILCLFSHQEDAVRAYGKPVAGCVSADGGRSWHPTPDDGTPMVAPHGAVTELAGGEFLCVPPTAPFDAQKHGVALPPPATVTERSYSRNAFYRLSDFPEETAARWAALPAVRWDPAGRAWRATEVAYDTRGMLLWARAEGEERFLLPRTWFERSPIRNGNEILYADYRSVFLQADGSLPRNWSPSLMASTDNGRSFQRRATIASSADGQYAFTEPALAVLPGGELVCVIRQTDHRQLPLLIAYSNDGGRHWTAPQAVVDFGVWPVLLQLECGVTVLSYGRPGVHLAFSEDGRARHWTAPLTLLSGDPDKRLEGSCGYTALLALDQSSFLMAYSDFAYRDEKGVTRKAIMTRRVETAALRPARRDQ
jgi:hypothetical protein